MMDEARKNGYNTVSELSRALNYKSSEKLYRLKRSDDNKPSFSVIEDLANLFDNIDLEYLITGIRSDSNREEQTEVTEDPRSDYSTKARLLQTLFDEDSAELNAKIDRILDNQDKILQRLNQGIRIDSISDENDL